MAVRRSQMVQGEPEAPVGGVAPLASELEDSQTIFAQERSARRMVVALSRGNERR